MRYVDQCAVGDQRRFVSDDCHTHADVLPCLDECTTKTATTRHPPPQLQSMGSVDTASVEQYIALRASIAQDEARLLQAMLQPDKCLHFLTPGRLVKVQPTIAAAAQPVHKSHQHTHLVETRTPHRVLIQHQAPLRYTPRTGSRAGEGG